MKGSFALQLLAGLCYIWTQSDGFYVQLMTSFTVLIFQCFYPSLDFRFRSLCTIISLLALASPAVHAKQHFDAGAARSCISNSVFADFESFSF